MTSNINDTPSIKSILDKLLSSNRLSENELNQIFTCMFKGELNESQISGFLCGLRIQGESETELYCGANSMREFANPVSIKSAQIPLLDNCGTGGDGSNSFNISTASAIIAAAVGCHIAKHGNRSVSSKCGSADLLFAAGLPGNLTPNQSATLLEKTNFTFFFAPNFHPVMKYVMPVRKSLGIRTIFNFLGPLANPIAPDFQVIGVGDKDAVAPIAKAAQKLGIKKALIIRSEGGLDEFSPAEPTNGYFLEGGKLSDFSFDPKSIGISGSASDLAGGDPDTNLNILNELLDGKKTKARPGVLLNAASVLWLYGKAESIEDAVELAASSIDSGATRKFFDSWIAVAKSL